MLRFVVVAAGLTSPESFTDVARGCPLRVDGL